MQEKVNQEFTPGAMSISLDATRIQSLEDLISRFKIDTNEWQVERFVCNKWEVAASPKATRDPSTGKWIRRSSKLKLQELFQVKAWLRKRREVADAAAIIAEMKRAAEQYAPSFAHVIRKGRLLGNMAEICIMDAHFGKLAWNRETGYDSYDVKIATDRYRAAMHSLLHRLAPYKIDQYLLIIGNDLLHSDNAKGTTTNGTQLEVDVRYHKTFEIVRQLLCEEIEKLADAAPVKVMIMPGNHDRHPSYHLGDSIKCWFRNHPNVEVDNEPLSRKYHQWGVCMIAACHGDEGKRDDYPLQMATEQPVMWAATKYREMHTGHLHKTKVDEFHGVRVRIIPSLGGTDRWSSRNGYTGNLKQAEAFVWNAKAGLIGTAVYVADK